MIKATTLVNKKQESLINVTSFEGKTNLKCNRISVNILSFEQNVITDTLHTEAQNLYLTRSSAEKLLIALEKELNKREQYE